MEMFRVYVNELYQGSKERGKYLKKKKKRYCYVFSRSRKSGVDTQLITDSRVCYPVAERPCLKILISRKYSLSPLCPYVLNHSIICKS